MKRAVGFFGIIAAAVIVAGVFQPINSYATETTNSSLTELDSFTGEAVESDDDDDSESGASLTYVTDGCSYETSTGFYSYSVDGYTGVVMSNVPSGMITTQPVYLTVDDSYSYTIYQNGDEYTMSDSQISDIGEYVVTVVDSYGTESKVLTFSIIGSVTGRVRSYVLPDNFRVQQVTLDGEKVLSDSNVVSFDEEGVYVVEYVCQATGVSYSLTLETDFTAPTLALEGVVDGRIHGPVDLSDIESGASVYLTRDGEEIDFSTTLTDSGQYSITVMDAAGNSNTYAFTILIYFNADTVVLLISMGVLLVAFAIYIYRRSRKMRVR